MTNSQDFIYKLNSRQNLENVAYYFNFDSTKLTKEEIMETLCNFGVPEEAIDVTDMICIGLVYNDDLTPAGLRITNGLIDIRTVEICRFEHNVISDTWEVTNPDRLTKFILDNYPSGDLPRIGDVLNIPDIFGRCVVKDKYGDVISVSPVKEEDTIYSSHKPNSINGRRYKISKVTVDLRLGTGMRVNIGGNSCDYTVDDHLLVGTFSR